jgi:hypothetical protein
MARRRTVHDVRGGPDGEVGYERAARSGESGCVVFFVIIIGGMLGGMIGLEKLITLPPRDRPPTASAPSRHDNLIDADMRRASRLDHRTRHTII